jgi:hypothetical protein
MVLVFVVACSTASDARQAMTGNDILRLCKSGTRADVNICWGYVEGVADRDRGARELEKRSQCRSHELDVSELVDIVVRFLDNNPGVRALRATFVIETAIADALGCF